MSAVAGASAGSPRLAALGRSRMLLGAIAAAAFVAAADLVKAVADRAGVDNLLLGSYVRVDAAGEESLFAIVGLQASGAAAPPRGFCWGEARISACVAQFVAAAEMNWLAPCGNPLSK